jgi:flagellar hook-basal body complex protein FliE
MAIGPIGPQLPLPPTYRPPLVRPPSGIGSDQAPEAPSIGPSGPTPTGAQPLEGPGAAASSFSQLLNDAVGQIDRLQKGADSNIQKLATGQPVDMHDVTISAEQANLSFQLGLQVRNKLIEAYQEVMRMQV